MTRILYLTLSLMVLVAMAAGQTTDDPEEQCSAEISARCPVTDPPIPVLYPDPDNCSKFCECSNGIAWDFDCPPGTLFNDQTSRCETAADVDCGDRPLPFRH